MTKKHKAKGGNQQKHNKRQSFRKSFARDEESTPTTTFSLRDEVFNTERHHSEWSPSVKLRDKAIQFVSAGSIGPLEEPKVDFANDQRSTKLREQISDDIEVEIEHSEGAMAQMNIESPLTTDGQVSNQANGHGATEDVEMSFTEDVSGLDGTDETPMFTIDTAGDASLRPKGAVPRVRTPSPTPSNSSDEVILFRGRNEHVTVQDDPPLSKSTAKSAAHKRLSTAATPSTTTASSARQSPHVTDSLLQVLDTQVSTESKKRTDKERETKKSPALPNARPWFKYEQPEQWVHADGTISKRIDFAAISDEEQNNDTNKVKEVDKGVQSRKGKNVRKRQNKKMNRMRQDLDEELMQDYIDNMSDAEMAAVMKTTLDPDDELWISSDMDDEDEAEIEAEIDRSAKKGPLHDGASSNGKARGWTSDEDEEDDDNDDDDDDEDDSNDEDDEGDDTDLEAELDYTEREMWEDEDDLRQRQIDAMTDEEIARILAKQEDLGIGGDELYLFDDSGFGDLESARAGLANFAVDTKNRPSRRGKRGGRKSDHFPDASLMADVLEQDPYGGFDIMDFDRPSLRNKPKGRKSLPSQLDDLSDEELAADLQNSWAHDRQKKKARKAEREELRALGLLGSGKRKGKTNLAEKYSEGMNMTQLRSELEMFLDTEGDTTKAFPPMAKAERKILHDIANKFNLTSNSRGSGKSRFTVFSKTQRTLDFDDELWNRAVSRAQRGFLPNMKAKGKGKKVGGVARRGGGVGGQNGAGSYRHGEVVGGTAPEIGESSFGRKLMEKMGWEKGMALGSKDGAAEGRLLVPVAATVRTGRGGLG